MTRIVDRKSEGTGARFTGGTVDIAARTRDDILIELAACGDVDSRPGRPPMIDGGDYNRRAQFASSTARRRARFRRDGSCLDCGRARDNETLRCGKCQAGRKASRNASRAAKRSSAIPARAVRAAEVERIAGAIIECVLPASAAKRKELANAS